MAAHDETIRIAVHPILGQDTRRATVRLVFDGQPLQALAGETVATLLQAHGIVVSRSMPDSGSPRGLFCGVGRCPDCMMTVDGDLNVRTCITPVRDGMVVETQPGLGTWRAHT